MKHIILILIAFAMLLNHSNAQQLDDSAIESLLDTQGELKLQFTISGKTQLKQFAKILTILSFNEESNVVKAWANRSQFENFLDLNISHSVYQADNDRNERLMSSNISTYSKKLKPGYTLEFPLQVYPTYNDYKAQMQNFETQHSDIIDFLSIGTTGEEDKELLFIRISDNIATDEAEPKLLYTSSMHGDEITGFPLMLDLIDYLITAYKDESHTEHIAVRDLINNSEIWINPNANPDGTYHLSPDNTSVKHARRGNHNNVDLNRNYPDYIVGEHNDGYDYQKETLLFMDLANEQQFILSANFHEGVELINFPWDNSFKRHPDNSWWILAAGEYRDNAQKNSPNGYMKDQNNGITHGADWYHIYGGRQDYMNHDQHCKELTIELSHTTKPPANQLINFWNYNRDALLDYLIQGTYGFRGYIKDATTGKPIKGATIKVVGHDALGSWTISDVDGDYYRPIFKGTYDLIFEAPNYLPVLSKQNRIANYETKMLDDVMMTPIPEQLINQLDPITTSSDAAVLYNPYGSRFDNDK